MLKQLAARKSVAAIAHELETGPQAEPGARPGHAHLGRARRDDRQRDFRADRHGRGAAHRPRDYAGVPRGGARLRPRRALLRGTCRDDSGVRQRVQLHVRDARRRHRVVRRLEPRARIRDVGRGRGRGLVRLRRQPARRGRHRLPRRPHQRTARQTRESPSRRDGRDRECARRADRRAADLGLLRRREAVDERTTT